MNRLPTSLPSIAVSALVRPSKILLCVITLYSVVLVCVAAAMTLFWMSGTPLTARSFVVGVTLIALWTVLRWLVRQRKIIRLDISMNGQIRLVEHNGLTGLPLLCQDKSGGNPVLRLMPDSVLWPGLLLLRLESENKEMIVLPILRDSMNAEAFRALSVACRWIAAQNNPAKGELF